MYCGSRHSRHKVDTSKRRRVRDGERAIVAHCRAARVQQTTNAPQLTDARRADATQQAANMQRLRDALKPLQGMPRRAGSAWAWAVLERGTGRSGQPLTPEIIRCAEDAIKNHARKGDE